MPRSLAAVALAALLLLGLSASAGAATLTFVRDHDVWIAAPDGTGAVQVTRDGTAAEPYDDPTMAADGTIAVARGGVIVLLRQNGREIRRFDAPRVSADSTVGDVHGLSFSPDGTKLTFARIAYSGSQASGISGVTDLHGEPLAGQRSYTGAYPQFIANDAVLSHGGATFFNWIWFWQRGPAEGYNWFDDWQVAGSPSEDLGDGELSDDRTAYVAIRGYSDPQWVATYRVEGGGDVSRLPLPTPLCYARGSQLRTPTISGDGAQAWWGEPDGIWTMPISPECPNGQLLIPGASQPDWSSAALNPGPAVDPSQGGKGAAKACKKLKGKKRKRCRKRAAG